MAGGLFRAVAARPRARGGAKQSPNELGNSKSLLARARVEGRPAPAGMPRACTRLALRLEEAIAGRAKANMVKGTNQHSPKQNSAEASNPIETREEIAKLAGVV